MKYTLQQIEEISHGKPADITSFITGLLLHIEKLEIQIDQQKAHIVKLETRVKVLERQVGLTSTNSSKSPSSDGLRKSGILWEDREKRCPYDESETKSIRFLPYKTKCRRVCPNPQLHFYASKTEP